jgi:hypothetical protein
MPLFLLICQINTYAKRLIPVFDREVPLAKLLLEEIRDQNILM